MGKEGNDNKKWITIADIFLTEMEDIET